jgi:hypothetical protein
MLQTTSMMSQSRFMRRRGLKLWKKPLALTLSQRERGQEGMRSRLIMVVWHY